MSKRFGRNQKRRMREALAAAQATADRLEYARELDQALLRNQSSTISQLRDFIGDVGQMVGRASVIAGEPPFLTNGFDGMQFAPVDRSQGYVPEAGDSPPTLEEFQYEILRLLSIEAIRDKFSKTIHFRVGLSDKEAAYGISESALAMMPTEALKNRMAHEIAGQIAEFLVKQIKGAA